MTIVIGIILGMAINNHFRAEAQFPCWDGPVFWGQPSAWYSSGFYSPVSQFPNYNVPYSWNQSYNSNGYLYFPDYGAQPYNGYYGFGYYSYTPESLQRAGNYQKANGSSTSSPSGSEYPIYEYPMYYEGDTIMELPPTRNPAYPPFACVFGGTGGVVLSNNSEDLNIVNPESPVYYLNPSSPYYGWWRIPKKGRPGDGKSYSEL
ncbi:MAG: hypothetical protein ACMUIU_18985 [bacterium]